MTAPLSADMPPEKNELRYISPKERLDAILESEHLTTDQAVRAMNVLYEENQATFPHVVIISIPVSSEPGGPDDSIYTCYVGPFVNKSAAIAWADPTLFTLETASFEVSRIDTPELYEAGVERIRRIIGAGEDPESL